MSLKYTIEIHNGTRIPERILKSHSSVKLRFVACLQPAENEDDNFPCLSSRGKLICKLNKIWLNPHMPNPREECVLCGVMLHVDAATTAET